ncbi:MAG: exodeoxyribonuclease I, partial [Rhodanobacteraceae bacterium]
REWQDGNSRWDIIDLARMCHALRPAGIEWPLRDDGAPSFRLEDLAAANKLEQRRAHDALSDVETTIALARLLKTRQPKLWDWYLKLRNKRAAADLLDIPGRTPVLHVSAKYSASRGCTTLIAPLAQHPGRSGEIIVYDLSVDPTELLSLDADAIADRVFTARDDLPEGIDRIALRTVRTNRSPALAPMSVLKGVDTSRIGLDVDTCLRHAARLRAIPDLAGKVRQVYGAQLGMGKAGDPELAIYDGFLPNADKPLLQQVRGTPPEKLADAAIAFRDPRYATLLFRYRARNWPHTLDASEVRDWNDFARQRLSTRSEATSLSLADYFAKLTALRQERPGSDAALLDQLQAWGMALADEFDIDTRQAD